MLPIAPFVALAALWQGTTGRPAPDTVVATVDGQPITAGEVEPLLWDWKLRDLLTEYTVHKMVAVEAAKKGVSATDAEVKARVDEQREAVKPNLQPGQTFEDFVKAQGGGMARLNMVARTAVLIDKIAELEFKPGDYVKVATIVFRPDGVTTDALSKAIKQADAAYASLMAGKPWQSVLQLYEKNTAVVQNGGAIGWKSMAVFPEGVRASLSTTKVMGYTKPVQTENGIQIFRLEARGGTAKPTDLADLKAQFIRGDRNAIIQRLRQSMKVEYK